MDIDEDLKPLVGIGVLLGLGWVLITLNTVRAIQSDASVSSHVVGFAIAFALALTLFAGAIGILMYGLRAQSFRIAGWTVLGSASVTLAIVLNIVGITHVQPNFTLALFMIVNAAAGGAVLGFLIGLYDARKELLQGELVEKTDQAEALSQQLSVLNRVLRHDIRNQSQIIRGYTEELLDDGTSAESMEGIRRANQRLIDLAEGARELQALLTDREFTNEMMDLVPVVREAGEVVQSTHPDLIVEYDLPEERFVHAPPLIEQAIKQILYNVAEHNDSDRPRAEVTLKTESASSEVATLSISDNGPGIPETEPIRAHEDTESPLRHSEGMGLWLVSWIIDEAGGDLEFETPPSDDVGAVVTVTLPAKPD